MATPRAQRIGIWIIAVVMLIGVIGSFFVMILNSQNQAVESANQQKLIKEYTDKLKKQEAELNDKYYPILSKYTSSVGTFNPDEVKTVTTQDLQDGDGEVIDDKTQYSAYYIGWNPNGEIFDQSIDNGKLKDPIPGQGLIPGWTEGVKGMKFGGVREITIPSDKAYGEKGSGDKIPPNTPIRFIVLAIPTPPQIPYPPELLQAMGGGNG